MTDRKSELERQLGQELSRALYGLSAPRPLVSVFGSARLGAGHADYGLARDLGRALANAGFGVITGGGPGLMEAANRGAREGGAPSLGACIVLPEEQATNPYVDRAVRFEFFFTRKLALLRASCGFACFPGGFGTADELFEALTLIQTRKLPHFPIVLLGTSYWAPLVAWIEQTLAPMETIAAMDRGLLRVTDDLAEAVGHFSTCHATLCAELGPGPHYPRTGQR